MSKEIPVVTLSSDEEERKEETVPDPAPPSPPVRRQTRQNATKSSGKMSVPKNSRNSDETDESSDSENDDRTGRRRFRASSNRKDKAKVLWKSSQTKESSGEEYTPSYKNVPPNCDKDLPALPEHLVDLNGRGQMFCPICKAVFKKKTDFILHRRRHVAPDHFMCSTCQKGFTKLTDCLDHEFELHHNQNVDGKNSKNSNQAKTKVVEKEQKEIIPSTCLYAYRGPPIRNMYEPYEIDYEYTRPEKKNNTRLKSKHILDKHLTIQEDTEALIEEALQHQDSQSQDSDLSQKVKASFVSRSTSSRSNHERLSSPKKPESNKVGPRPGNGNSEGKFKCKKCGYTFRKKRNIEAHIDDKHPSIPDHKILDYIIFYSKTERPSVEPSGSGSGQSEAKSAKAKATASTSSSVKVRESRPSIVLSFNNISQNVCTSPPKERGASGALQRLKSKKKNPKKKEKESKKKKVTFGKRLDAIRVWEKTKEPLTKPEFLSALSLISNSDVLLGPRQGLRRIESSLFGFRRVYREKSPPPHARILLDKLPAEHSMHNHVHLCNICDFVAVTSTEIRNHRRNEHLKNNDACTNETEGSQSQRRSNSNNTSHPNSMSMPEQNDRLADSDIPSTSSAVPCAGSTDDFPPDENKEKTLYQCGRCDFHSYDRKEVKTHRRDAHKRRESDDSSLPSAKSAAEIKPPANGNDNTKAKATSAPAAAPAPARPNVTIDDILAVDTRPLMYQCDKCDYISIVRWRVKEHRKETHKKNNSDNSSGGNLTPAPTRPQNKVPDHPGPRPPEQRLNNFAKPTNKPPKKKFKPNK